MIFFFATKMPRCRLSHNENVFYLESALSTVGSSLGSTLEGQIYNSPVAIDTQIDLKATLTTCS